MKFYGQFNPPVDEVIFRNYFPEKRNGFFIECGAYDGVLESSCKFFEETMGWQGLNIEASPRIYERLVSNRPLSENLHCALADSIGHSRFYDIASPKGLVDGNGSLEHTPEHLRSMARDHGDMFPSTDPDLYSIRAALLRSVLVPVMTYQHVLTHFKHIQHVDLMVLDVEGCELRALAGMVGARVIPSVMCVEATHSGFPAVREAVEHLGLTYDFMQDVNAFFSDRIRIKRVQ